MVGYRNHSNATEPDAEMILEYEKQCSFFEQTVEKRFDHERLTTLHISNECWDAIHHFEDEMESLLADGQMYSHPVMRRFVRKSRMQIMGLASNLYLFDVEPENIPSDRYSKHYIPHQYVESAISMMRNLIDYVHVYCTNNGVISPDEQIKAVYDLFASNAVLTMHEIKKKCEKNSVFKNLSSSRQVVEDIVYYLEEHYVLLKMGNDSYVKNTESYSHIPNRTASGVILL